MAQERLGWMIYEFTREEILGEKLTQSSIDHIHVRSKEGKPEGQVVSEKVPDHYFVAVTLADFISNSNKAIEGSVINNKIVDKYFQEIDWNVVTKEQNPEKSFNNINIFKDIYAKSTHRCSTKKQTTV